MTNWRTPRYTARLQDFMTQSLAGMAEEFELFQREVECWRMFGIELRRFQDEYLCTTVYSQTR